MNKKLENNWRSAVYGLHEIVTHGRVWCFSMNSTKMFTAEIMVKEDGSVSSIFLYHGRNRRKSMAYKDLEQKVSTLREGEN